MILTVELPKIYPLTDRAVSGLSHIEQVRRLIDGGASLIQIRDKSASSSDFLSAAKQVVQYAHERGVRIIVNDRVDIALCSGADGVHLGQDDLPVDEARKILGCGSIIGHSTHSLDQLRAAIGLPLNYIAFGPIFATSTKTDHDPVVGLEELKAARKICGTLPLVAIGGIDRDTAASALNAGADSIALIHALLADPALISERLRKLRSDTV